MGWIDRNDQANLISDVSARLKQLQNPNPADAAVAKRLGEIYAQHPYIQTGTALSLAESMADDATVAAVAGTSTVTAYQKGAALANEPGNPGFWSEVARGAGMVARFVPKAMKVAFGWNLGQVNALKPVSRVASAVGQFPWEYYNNYVSRLTDPNKPLSDTEGIIASTSLGALLQHWGDAGNGYFLGGEAEKKRVEKVRKYRWQFKNGDSHTIGRGTASLLFQPGTKEYNFLSGVIDAAGSFYTDPTNKPLDELSKIAKLRREIGTLGTVDEINAAMALANGAGLGKAETAAIDQSKFFRWLDGTRRGRRVVTKLAEETSPLKIMEGMNWKVSPDTARALATETDPNKIRGIIGEAASVLAKTTEEGMTLLPTNDSMLPYASAWNTLGQKLPGYQSLRESRWFTKMPKNFLMVNGTPEERNNGIKNIVNWMRTLGVDTETGDGKKLIDLTFDWASEGSKTSMDQVRKLFVGNARNPGILATALKQNGVKPEVIDGIYNELGAMVGRLRSYAIDEGSRISDKGFFNYVSQFASDNDLRKTLKDLFPNEIHSQSTRQEMDALIAGLDEGLVANVGPSALSEMLNNVVVLPDVRQMRMLTNPLFKGRELKPVMQTAHVVDFVQNELWRPYALMTFGFILRNTFDAHTRMAMNGVFQPSNPWHWWTLLTNRKGLGTLSGTEWVDVGKDTIDNLDGVANEFARTSHFKSANWVDNPNEQLSKLVRDGQVTTATPKDGIPYIQGVVDEARLMHFNDPLARTQARYADLPLDMQSSMVAKWLDSGTDDAVKARRTLVDQLKSGLTVANRNDGTNKTVLRIADAEKMTTQELVSTWFEHGRHSAVSTFTMDTPEMRVLVGYNDVALDSGTILDNATVSNLLPQPGSKVERGALMVEDLTVDPAKPKFRYHRVLEDVGRDAQGKPNKWRVVEVARPGEAIVGDAGSFELRNMIEQRIATHADSMTNGRGPLMPSHVKYEVRTNARYRSSSGKVYNAAGQAADILTKPAQMFFRGPVSSFAKMAERSPAFREIYYRHLGENAKYLTKGEAEQALVQLDDAVRKAIPERYAKDALKASQDYLGGKANYERFMAGIDEAIATNAGVGTVQDLEQYAATAARMDAEDMFFSNMDRSNFTDAVRILGPFAAAWAEVFGKYMGEMYRNPSRIRRVQMTYRGLEGEQGQGIFYKDKQTGQLMFTFPLSSQVIKFATSGPLQVLNKVSPIDLNIGAGINPLNMSSDATVAAELVAPVKQLSAGLAVIPSFGPVAQIAASKIFDRFELPNEQSLRAIINPYGTSNFDALLPGPWKKAIEAIKGGEKVTDSSTYATSYQDVFSHLASTGNYDLADTNEVQRLHSDAKAGARVITMLRAISQFVGPTAGRPAYQYTKKDRNNPALDQTFYVGEIVKAFSMFQQENYETAVPRFIEAFGPDAYIYMAGKTRVNPAYKGLEVSKEFEQWRVKNRGLIASHKSTASYLAPVGDRTLAIEAWNNQMGEALRYRTDGFDRLDLAQYRVGSGLFRAFRNQLPAELTDAQEGVLADYRQQLHDEFPAFPVKSTFATNELPKFIEDLRNLVADKRTEGNKVRDAIQAYLDYRDQNIQYVKAKSGKTLTAKKDQYAMRARGNLYGYGQKLVEAVPDFSRVWDEMLSTEVETAQGD